MEPGDCHRLIEQSAALRARSGETHQVSAEIIATSKELAAQTAQLLEVTVSIRADAHGAVPAEVRRARSAPGFGLASSSGPLGCRGLQGQGIRTRRDGEGPAALADPAGDSGDRRQPVTGGTVHGSRRAGQFRSRIDDAVLSRH